MATEITMSKDKVAGTKIKIPCKTCAGDTKHEVLKSIDIQGIENGNTDYWFGWNSSYQIIQCRGCETVSFREITSNSEEMVQTGPNEWEDKTYESLYPDRAEGREAIKDHHLLPDNLERIYLETIKALNASQPVLAGIGIRAVIETICKDKYAAGSNLSQQIDGLVTQGVLTKEGAQILHKLRTLGNKAAHEVAPHDAKQLGLALDVIDHLFLGVYLLPMQASKTFKS